MRIEMGKLSKKGSGEGESKLKKRKRPAGAKGSRDAVWGNSLAWKNVTPNDPLSILIGSDEGGALVSPLLALDCLLALFEDALKSSELTPRGGIRSGFSVQWFWFVFRVFHVLPWGCGSACWRLLGLVSFLFG